MVSRKHSAYYIEGPIPAEIPLIIDSPHSSGRIIKNCEIVAPREALLTSWDAWIHELFGIAPSLGATMLVAEFPRWYVDVNRNRNDLDADLLDGPWLGSITPSNKTIAGMGVIRRYALPKVPIYDRRLTVADIDTRLTLCYDPYVKALEDILSEATSVHDNLWYLDCHSMKSVGNAMNDDSGLARPDFSVSNGVGQTSSSEALEFIGSTLKSFGYHVGINEPYKGGDLIHRAHRLQPTCESIQIEINRALYMDETRFTKNANFTKVQEDVSSLMHLIRDRIQVKSTATNN
ncbi:MAG: N-formylglutamate amidohydrolase [Desulfuromonadales bacterium]|nr:N-formylglutamate amidohydrolase [Desulfuromonadales bacterium]